LSRSLRQAGLETAVVYEAGSGTEGLDLLRAKKVDADSFRYQYALDGWPGVSDRQLRAQNPGSRSPGGVMITTESSEEHVKQAILAGRRGIIRKPFTADQVKERVLPLLPATA